MSKGVIMTANDEESSWEDCEISHEEAEYYRRLLREKGRRDCVALALRRHRLRNAQTQAQAAADLGVDRTSWGCWERRARDMQIGSVRQLLESGCFHSVHFGLEDELLA